MRTVFKMSRRRRKFALSQGLLAAARRLALETPSWREYCAAAALCDAA